jgi:HAD superfamily hydrolase (TIGR01509 family)
MNTAVIFDMDGVISDTQKFHAQVESQLLQDLGVALSPEEITKKYAGVQDEQMFEEIFASCGIKNIQPADLIKRKWKTMLQIAKGNITPIAYVIPLIKKLKKNNFHLAVASSSTKEFITTVLEELSLSKYFDTIVSGYDVARGKPSPDIFLLAAKKLGVEKYKCVVIEDGTNGMLAAKAAGIKCIGLVNDTTKEYPATILVTSLKEVTVETIGQL